VNGVKGTVIAAVAAFLVGTSLGLIGGVLLTRFVATPAFMRDGPGGPGGPGDVVFFRRSEGRPGPRERVRMRVEGRDRFVFWIDDKLNLDATQREQIHKLLDDTRRAHETDRDSLRARIERVLTPEQRKHWKEMEDRFEGQHRRDLPPPPGPDERP
jgi:hypothetical protein